MSILTAALLDAACFERDRRAESYPLKIAEGADAEKLTIDFQCWVAIAEWLDTDRFMSFTGGADPDAPGAPVIRWPDLEAAARTALDSVAAKLAGEQAFLARPRAEGEEREPLSATELEALQVRRARLFAIHAKVQRMREAIDLLNNEFKPRAVAEAA
jgi:hypothetical protein